MPRAVKYSLLGFAALLALMLVMLIAWRTSANRQVEQRLAAMRAAGEPVTLADIASPLFPAERNAYTYLMQAEPQLKAIETAVGAAETAAGPRPSEQSPPAPSVQAAKRAALAQHAKVIELLDKASRCPAYSSGLTEQDIRDLSMIDSVQVKRSAARALTYHAEIALENGDPQTALRDCVILLRLSRLFDADPAMVNYLVALAVRGMAVDTAHRTLRAGPLPADLHQQLDQELAQHDLVKSYRQMLSTERAYGIQMFDVMVETNPLLRLWTIASDQNSYLDYMGLAIDRADRPYADSQSRAKLGQIIDSAGHFTHLVAPALGAASYANYRMTAQLRALRVLNALVQQPAEADASQVLAQLGLPVDATTDPFSGKPLLVRKIPEGWIVYSVGGKLADDGGMKLGHETDKNVGLSPLAPVPEVIADPDSEMSEAAPSETGETESNQPEVAPSTDSTPSNESAPPDQQF